MNRKSRFSKANVSKNNPSKGNAAMNASVSAAGSTPYAKPLHSSDDGHQLLDASNPFSHLALEVKMDRPSANPFDSGVMPSFDDFAIDTAYRSVNFKKSTRDDKKFRPKKPARKEAALKEVVPPPLLPAKLIPTETPKEIFRDVVHVPIIPEVQEELNLDDFFLPKPPPIVPSVDLKPQINIRSRKITVAHTDSKPHINVCNSEPVVEPVIIPAATQKKPIIDYFGTQRSSEPELEPEVDQKEECFKESQLEANKMLFGVEHPSRPLTNVEVSKRKKLVLKLVDQKLKAKLSELMNRIGTAEVPRPNSRGDIDERIDTFEDQMQNFVPDSVPDNVSNPEPTQNWVSYPSQAHEQTWNNYPPDAPNKDNQSNWPIRPPMYQSNPGWVGPSNPYPPGVGPMHNMNFSGVPPARPPWHINSNQWQPPHQWQLQHNWNMRPLNPHLVQPNVNLVYPPDDQYQKPISNPHQFNDVPVPTITQLSDVSTSEAEQALREKEFLERTLLGGKNKSQRQTDLRRTPELNRRSRERTSKHSRERPIHSRDRSRHSHDRSRHSQDRSRQSRDISKHSHETSRHSRDRLKRSRSRGRSKRNSQERPRERLNRETGRPNRTSSNRSAERISLQGVLSPSRLSPFRASSFGLRDRSESPLEHPEQWLYEEFPDIRDPFEESIYEHTDPPYKSTSREFRRSTSRSEDLRIRLSQRRIRERDGSPSDLRNKLLLDRADSRRHRQADDLRHHLSERSHNKRSRSHSRSRSSKRSNRGKTDCESEWIRFNNIVATLMDLSTEKSGELTPDQLGEKKEIMRLLLENPDLLELDDKFVQKFGVSRLNVAVKEAENVLYPNGIPDERIASLISQKISTMSTDITNIASKPKETVPIEWIKLCSIVDQMLDLPVGARKNLSSTDKRMIERDELLLKISDDPNKLLLLGTKYGHRNVEWAVKFANKILLHNGVRDRRVDEVISKERDIILKRTGKIPSSSKSKGNDNVQCSKTNSMEWNRMHDLVTELIQSQLDKGEEMSRVHIRRRDELLIQMSRDPDAVRSDKKFTDYVDKTLLKDIIDKCKKLINSVRSNDDKQVVHEFECQRTNLIKVLKSNATTATVYEQIRLSMLPIFGKGTEKLTKRERGRLIDDLIKDPESLKTNTKAVELIGDQVSVDNIILDIKRKLMQLDVSKARKPKKFHISSSKVIDIPFVVKIEDVSGQLDNNTKTVLLKALREMISEIENPPKPKLLQQRYIDTSKCVEVVCANLLTFEWLKRVIVSDFKGKWNGAQLKVERVPVVKKISRDKLKTVVVAFKDVGATLPFDDIMDEIKKANFKLHPERWELLDARGKDGDYKKKTIGIDIESLAALETVNRFAHFGRSLIYFDICYMGDDVPNFETTCQ